MDQMARSASIPQRLRNEGIVRANRNKSDADLCLESWVEISSQPSSSSLSSIGDEIVTTGLRVQQDPNTRRRRRTQPAGSAPIGLETRHTGTSSQEEYDESESEEDHVMTSSNEHVIRPTQLQTTREEYDAGSDSDDDDENATALGRRTEPTFTPQPNAFSHPPSSQGRPMAPGSYFPRTSQPAPSRPSYPNRSRTQHASYNQADHDAALRASLTTLLSIGAAAARGLPKREQNNVGMTNNEPMSLRFVPESELVGPPSNAANSSRPLTPSTRARSSPSISSQEAATVDKGKRKASGAKPSGEKARMAKKKKVQLVDEAMISPTLLTWVMSAGVVVLVSVVGFGAGYVIGREVGRGEALSGLNGTAVLDGGSCGREVVRGSSGSLRRFRWGSGVAKSIVA